jgi:hypothetical protein
VILSADQRAEAWPDLPLSAWNDTRATLHLWTQIVGKVRLTQSPWINHSWHVTLPRRCVTEVHLIIANHGTRLKLH